MASFQQSLIDALQLDKFPKLKSFVESTEMAPTEDVVGAADMPMPKTIDNETIQTNLNAFLSRKGSNKRLSVDGIIGTDTTSVIKDFQKAQGLEADGIVGSKTISALYSMPSIGSSNVEVKTLEPSQVSDAPIEPPVSKGIMAKQEPTKEVTPAVMPEELSVEQIQGYLTIEGFDVGGVDGKMGPKTRRAIREFQKSKGLKVDGIVGKNTIAALLSEPKEDPLADKRPKARPSLMSPDEEEEFDASQSVSREGQISGESKFLDALMDRTDVESEQSIEKPTGSRVSGELGDVKTASIIGSIPLPKTLKKPLEGLSNLFGAVLSPVGKNFMNDMVFGEGYSGTSNPLKNLPISKKIGLGDQKVVGEEVFSPDALELMRRVILDKRNKDGTDIFDNGSISIGKEIYGKGGINLNQAKGGSSAKEIIRSLSEGSDPINEIKLMLGQFNASIDDNGDIIVKDQFNYNDIVVDGVRYKTEEYEQAIKDGKFTDADVIKKILANVAKGKLNYKTVRDLGFVLGSRSYEDKSKTQGRRFEINLGPAVLRPKAKPLV